MHKNGERLFIKLVGFSMASALGCPKPRKMFPFRNVISNIYRNHFNLSTLIAKIMIKWIFGELELYFIVCLLELSLQINLNNHHGKY